MDKYPYTNFHELNLTYFLKHFKEIFQQWDELYQEMQSWKTATEEELETWKNAVVADIEAWETALLGQVGDWEDALMASLAEWKEAFETLFASTFSDLTDIKTAAENARDAAIAAQEAAEAAAATLADSVDLIGRALHRLTSDEVSAIDPTAYPMDCYWNGLGSSVATKLPSIPYTLSSSALYWVISYRGVSDTYPTRGIVDVTRANGTEYYRGYYSGSEWTWTDLSWTQVTDLATTVTNNDTAINAKFGRALHRLTSDEVSAIDPTAYPMDCYWNGLGSSVATKLPSIPYTLSSSALYWVISYRGVSDTYPTRGIVDVTRANGAEYYRGYYSGSEWTWADLSVSAINDHLDDIDDVLSDVTDDEFILTEFETDGKWYNYTGALVNYASEKSKPIPVKPGKTYYTAGLDENNSNVTAASGAWLDKSGTWMAPMAVISLYREGGSGTPLKYSTNCVVEKTVGGVKKYYQANKTINAGSIWSAGDWDEITKPAGYAEIVDYDIPSQLANPATAKYWLKTDLSALNATFCNLYSITVPEGAAYLVLNIRGASSHVKNTVSLSTLPMIGVTGYPNRRWKKTDPAFATWQHKKLCVIGPSGVVMDRDFRDLSETDTPDYESCAGFQEYLIPYFNTVTSLGYSGRNYMQGFEYVASLDGNGDPVYTDHTGTSIYDKIVTDQYDLSGFDFFMLQTGLNDMGKQYFQDDVSGEWVQETDQEYAARFETLLGAYNSRDPETMCGGLNLVIDYIYSKTANRTDPPSIFIDGFTFTGNAENRIAAYEELKKLAANRHISFIDRYQDQQFNIRTVDRFTNDGTHLYNYGNYLRAMIYINKMI